VNELSKTERALPWMLVTPALLWTLLFFVAPFVAMALLSLNFQGEGGMTVANYSQFFANPSYYRAMINSLQVTGWLLSFRIAYFFPCRFCRADSPTLARLALLLAICLFDLLWCAPIPGFWCWQ
jgi:spermidine/putrescine transport system permease protein